ncbi:hypothetical protein PMAYCL1PPCAC_24718, partial [Pristionchus mayeri]
SYKRSLEKKCERRASCYKDEFFYSFKILKQFHDDFYMLLPSVFTTRLETRKDIAGSIDIIWSMIRLLVYYSRYGNNFDVRIL